MFPILNLGPLAIQTPGLILLISAWFSLTLSEKYSTRCNVHPNLLYNLIFSALLAGVVMARLTYVALYPSAFLASPLSILSLNPGLLDPWGGLVGAMFASLIFASRKKMPSWSTLDALTPALAVSIIGFHLASLASGIAYGNQTDVPWAIELWGTFRHPVQLYATLTATFTLLVVWPSGKLTRTLQPGGQFLTFLSLTAFSRLILEAFRGDSYLVLNRIRSAQLIAWFILAISLWGLRKKLSKPEPSDVPSSVNQNSGRRT